jgi:LacI family transcriptional regulator
LSAENIVKIHNDGTPVVVIDRYFKNSELPYIGSDNYQGAYDAVEHIIENGHKRIAIIKGINGTVPNDERVRGYRDAIENYGLQLDKSLIVGDSFGEQNGYLETKLLLQHKNPPTAIFATSNLISLGVLRAC